MGITGVLLAGLNAAEDGRPRTEEEEEEGGEKGEGGDDVGRSLGGVASSFRSGKGRRSRHRPKSDGGRQRSFVFGRGKRRSWKAFVLGWP